MAERIGTRGRDSAEILTRRHRRCTARQRRPRLRQGYVIHPGEQDYSLSEKVQAVGVGNLVGLRETWEKE